ncbi:MAG: DUF1801 domain-containing protein, partial [Gemmatimonadota bacterium]
MPVKKSTRARSTATGREVVNLYLGTLPVDARKSLKKLRRDILAAAPGAVDTISYGLPSFRLEGKILVCYRAARTHCSFHPMSGQIVGQHAADLKGYETSKGTIRFEAGTQLPAGLVRKIVRSRMAEMR